MSTRVNGLFPCASCTLLRQPTPAPNTHHREFFQQKHIVTEPLATVGIISQQKLIRYYGQL